MMFGSAVLPSASADMSLPTRSVPRSVGTHALSMALPARSIWPAASVERVTAPATVAALSDTKPAASLLAWPATMDACTFCRAE